MQYWDTSALAKLYVVEADAAAFVGVALANPAILTSAITRFEMRCLLSRKCALEGAPVEIATATLGDFERDVARGRISVVAVDQHLNSPMEKLLKLCGGRSPSIALRTMDAIHLSTALSSGADTIVTTDTRMRTAGKAVGLA
ncbi:MAG: type II toxin-antitoxin system VapC family toxin, partial [Verrucomicrobiota bacterium]|nr:type II toxin-antitoxin system VapC family toxin [Verrucomicrobiota bacterium]